MTNKLLLVTNERFGTLDCNFWRDKHNNIYVTRNQIGEGLGYTSPDIAISKIHSRNKTRLDKFSVITKLVSTDGKEYETTLYNRQGIYEICRHSKMKKADEFYDWVYSVLDTLHEEKIFHAVQREIEKNNRRTLTDAIKESKQCNSSHHMKFSNLIIKVVTGLQPNQIKKRLGVDKTVVTADILSSGEVKQVKEVESKVIMLLDLDFDYYQIKAALYGEPLTVGTTKKMTS